MAAEQFLLRQLDDLNNLHAVRITIVELIRQKLNFLGDSLGEWEKVHITIAIGALSMNIDAPQQPTNVWLYLCLTALGKVFNTPTEHDELGPERVIIAEDVNHEKLMQAVESVARKIK